MAWRFLENPVTSTLSINQSDTMAVCKTCNLAIEEQEIVKCSGVCGFVFHARLKCGGIKSDLAKQMKKCTSVRYVCEECKDIKSIHIIKAIEMCNANVKLLDDKLENILNYCNKNSRRVSVLE